MAARGYTYGDGLQIRKDAGSPSPGTISGPVVVYGDVAPNPYGGLGPERMAAGAWGPDVGRQPWTANLMHNRAKEIGETGNGLTLTDSSSALSAEIVLPDSDPGRETAMLARRGQITGLSGEFDILQQYRADDGVRELVRVAGDAVGVVDRPAYGQSKINIRQAAEQSAIIAGPAGAGKTQRARELLAELTAAGYEPLAADFQSILAALLLLERLPDGRYPERLPNQAYALATVEYLRTAIIRNALENDRPVVATISERPTGARHGALLALFDGRARQEVIDPGIDVVIERLSQGDTISEQCADAMRRWYSDEEVRAALEARRRSRRRRTVI